MVPSSSSSSLTRQHRPHPSHSDSHSESVISASDFVFQNGASSAMAARYAARRAYASEIRSPFRRNGAHNAVFAFTLLSFRHWRGGGNGLEVNKLTGLADSGAPPLLRALPETFVGRP